MSYVLILLIIILITALIIAIIAFTNKKNHDVYKNIKLKKKRNLVIPIVFGIILLGGLIGLIVYLTLNRFHKFLLFLWEFF